MTLPAALTRRRWLVATTLGLQVAFYLVVAAFSALSPHAVIDEAGEIKVQKIGPAKP